MSGSQTRKRYWFYNNTGLLIAILITTRYFFLFSFLLHKTIVFSVTTVATSIVDAVIDVIMIENSVLIDVNWIRVVRRQEKYIDFMIIQEF